MLLAALLIVVRPRRFARVATILITFARTIEADRVLRLVSNAGLLAMPMFHARQLAWTIWWTTCLAGVTLLKRQLEPAMPASRWPRAAVVVVTLLAGKFLLLDALLLGLFSAPGRSVVIANLQCFTAAVVLAALALFHLRSPYHPENLAARARYGTFASVLASLLLLVTGGLELHRFFTTTSSPLAEQVAFSIYFAVYAIVLVSIGFKLRRAPLRYFALALYALTLVKVMLVDLAHVTTGYRILSCMGLGLLLLATSVLYGQVSPRLAQKEQYDIGVDPAGSVVK